MYLASAENNPISLSNYAMRLETGKGVRKNKELAAEKYY